MERKKSVKCEVFQSHKRNVKDKAGKQRPVRQPSNLFLIDVEALQMVDKSVIIISSDDISVSGGTVPFQASESSVAMHWCTFKWNFQLNWDRWPCSAETAWFTHPEFSNIGNHDIETRDNVSKNSDHQAAERTNGAF